MPVLVGLRGCRMWVLLAGGGVFGMRGDAGTAAAVGVGRAPPRRRRPHSPIGLTVVELE